MYLVSGSSRTVYLHRVRMSKYTWVDEDPDREILDMYPHVSVRGSGWISKRQLHVPPIKRHISCHGPHLGVEHFYQFPIESS